MREVIIRIHFENLLQPTQSFIRTAGVNQKLSFQCVDSQIKRIEFAGAFDLRQSFRVLSRVRQQMRIEKMSVRIIWVEVQSPLVLSLGCFPVPIEPENYKPKFGMRIGETIVELNCLLRR